MEGKGNLIMTPSTKHCQAGVGHLWDQVCGERSGEEGAGEEDETPESAAIEVAARWGSRPYLGSNILIFRPISIEKKIFFSPHKVSCFLFTLLMILIMN